MKKPFFLSLAIIILFATSLSASESEKLSYKPKEGYVPDAITAIKIAEAVLIPIYGEKQINSEKPLNAELKDGIWIVTGTLNCLGGGHDCPGGVAIVEISKEDGRILRVIHEQ
jgi:hypothetical protein